MKNDILPDFYFEANPNEQAGEQAVQFAGGNDNEGLQKRLRICANLANPAH